MRHNKKAVRCVETFQVYPSAVEASTAMGLNPMSVAISISKGCRSGGHFWEYVENDGRKDIGNTAEKIFELFQGVVRLVPMSEMHKVEPLVYRFEREMDKLMGHALT